MVSAVETHHAARAETRGEIVVPEAHDYEIRTLTIADLKDAVRLGYEDFRAKPSHMLVLGFVYPLGAAIVAGLALGENLLPLVFPIAAGLALLGPVAAIVLYEISRRREQGRDFEWSDLGAVFERMSTGGVAVMIAGLFAAFGIWVFIAQLLFQSLLGSASTPPPLEFVQTILSTPEGWTLILVGNAIGFVFAAAVLATNIVSFPMLLERQVGAPAAVVTSLRVTAKNPITVAAWGLFVALSLLAGGLLFLVGLGVIVPVLGHATWHLYRKAVAIP